MSTSGALLDGSSVIGHCAATFALGDIGYAVLPWERPDNELTEAVNEESLDEAARMALDAARRAVGADRAWSDTFLEAVEATSLAGMGATYQSRLQMSPLMANRAGTVQGGVLLALVVRSAITVAGPSRVVASHIDFIAAASIERPLDAAPVTLRSGRKTSFIRTEIRQDGGLVASASIIARRSGNAFTTADT